MARTNAAAVKTLMAPGRDYDTRRNPDLSPFIDTASLMVDRVAECAEEEGDSLSDAALELIERWLSAHFYQQSDQGYSSKSTGGASGSFHGQTGMRLEGTKYGQTALDLDHSGCLQAITGESRAEASLDWLGKPPSEQIPLRDRD